MQTRLLAARGLVVGPALWLLAALTCAPAAGFSQTVTAAEALVVLDAMTPRPAGSEAQRAAMRYVEARLQALAVPHALHPGAGAAPAAEAGAIVAQVPGRSQRTLVLVVALDHPPQATVGRRGSVAIVAALHALERATRDPPAATLRVIFAGSEHGPAGPSGIGGARLAADAELAEPAAVVYVNLEAVPEPLVLRTDGRAGQTPRWLLDAVAAALDGSRLPFTARSTANQLARIGLPLARTMAEPYLAAGHPAIELAGRYGDAAAAREGVRVDAWITDFGHFVQSLSARLAAADTGGWERHYLFVRVGPLRLALDEQGVVTGVALALTLALALWFLLPGRWRRYRRMLLRSAWLLPLVAAGTLAALTVASVLLSSLLVARDLPALWRLHPGLALTFKAATALLLITAAIKGLALVAVRWLPGGALPSEPGDARGGSLHAGVLSAAAAALLPLVIAAAAAIDLATSLPFIAAYAGTLLFGMAHLRAVKAVWLAAAAAVPAAATADLVLAGADGLLQALLLSPGIGDAVLTVALLPFLLMALRLTLRSRESLAAWGERRRLTPLVLLLALTCAVSGAALYLAA